MSYWRRVLLVVLLTGGVPIAANYDGAMCYVGGAMLGAFVMLLTNNMPGSGDLVQED